MSGRRARAGACLAVALSVVAPGPAVAEEGVVTAKATGGAAMVGADRRAAAGAVELALDLGLTDAVGPVLGVSLQLADPGTTVGLGAGVKWIPVQGEWTRLTVRADPQLQLARGDGGRSGAGVRADLALHAAVGVEHLLMWGLGLAVEVSASVPTGLLDSGGPQPAWAGVLAGLYMEI